MTCTLPDLLAIMKHVRVEHTDRVCPEHRVHLVRDCKLRDDLRIDQPKLSTPPSTS